MSKYLALVLALLAVSAYADSNTPKEISKRQWLMAGYPAYGYGLSYAYPSYYGGYGLIYKRDTQHAMTSVTDEHARRKRQVFLGGYGYPAYGYGLSYAYPSYGFLYGKKK